MKITYELLKPIIVKKELNGNQIKIWFKTDNQDEPIQTIGIVSTQNKLTNKKTTVKEQQQAVINAFEGLQIFYKYDEVNNKWEYISK